MNRKLFTLAILTSILGLLSLASLVVFNISYPHPLFQVLGAIGLLFLFLSLFLFAAAWLFSIRKELLAGHRSAALLLLAGGILFLAIHLWKLL